MSAAAKKRAAIYARFSSDAQRDVSIDIQVRHCTELIERKGWSVAGVYADYAMTGRNDARPEFQRMRTDMEAGAWDVLVVYKQDRLARNMALAQSFKSSLFALGVHLWSVREGEVIDTPEGFINSSIQDMFAEYYSRNLSVLIKGGIDANARECKANGQPLYGWRINEEGRYEIDEEQRAHLVMMKDMLLAGSTVADIERASKGYRTQRGKRFSHSGITKLLKREQNAGVYKYAGYVVPGGMPALWPMEDQERVWAILNGNANPRKAENTEDFPLSGKMTCARCGSPMVGTSGTSHTGRRYYYYKCRKCRKQVRKEAAEEAVKQAVVDALADEARREWIADMVMAFEEAGGKAPQQSELLRKEIRKADAARARIWDAIEEGLDLEGAKERLDTILERRAELQQRLDAAELAEAVEITRDRVLFWLEGIANASPEEVVDTFVRRVVKDGDEYRVVCTFEDEEPPDDLPPDDGPGGPGGEGPAPDRGPQGSHEWYSAPPPSFSRYTSGCFHIYPDAVCGEPWLSRANWA